MNKNNNVSSNFRVKTFIKLFEDTNFDQLHANVTKTEVLRILIQLLNQPNEVSRKGKNNQQEEEFDEEMDQMDELNMFLQHKMEMTYEEEDLDIREDDMEAYQLDQIDVQATLESFLVKQNIENKIYLNYGEKLEDKERDILASFYTQ